MKQLFTFLLLFQTILANPDYCRLNISDLEFLQPQGFKITNTWAENGVLSMYEESTGNGIDVLVDTKNVDMQKAYDDRILSIRDEWSKSIINEEKLPYGGHVFRIRNTDIVQPVDTIIILPGDSFVIESYLMKTGDPKTHGAFEDTALEILRSIEQGGSNEKRAKSCVNGLLLSF